jgi:hypothetical protein
MHTLSVVLIMLVTALPFAARVHYHHPIAYDDQYHLAYQVRFVDIPVLNNDIGPGPEPLRVVTVSGVEGGRAEIIDGKTVRVTVDWASYAVWSGAGGPMGRVAHGSYIISNGYAQSRGTWTIWYVPDMKV